jgi:uncharacterized LabA/DUF88 family protein
MADLSNSAFIDGQNLHLGTRIDGWSIDHKKFRTYLSDKYKITRAYYFLGFFSDKEDKLYKNLRETSFELLFREHSSEMLGRKKGNVDSDIIFEIMRGFAEHNAIDKFFIVSGDGDYKKVVDFLIKKGRFGKMLFPNRKFASSLYTDLGRELFDYLGDPHIRTKIEYGPK